MATETLTMDPDGTSVALWDPVVGISVLDQRYPPPPHKVEYAESTDTEGGLPAEPHYENRDIEVKLLVRAGSTTLIGNIQKLQRKVGLWQREGGVLKRTLSGGQVINFDIVNANIDFTQDRQFIQRGHTEATLSLEARPFGYGTESTSSTTTELT